MNLDVDHARRCAIEAPLGPKLVLPDTEITARPGWYELLTPSARGTFLNEIALSALDGDDRAIEAAIDAAIERFHARGLPVKWCVGPWSRPDDLGDRLARRGFDGWDVRGMAASPTMPVEVRATGCEVVEVTDDTGLEAFLDAQIAGWGAPPELRGALRAMFAPEIARGDVPGRIARLFVALDGDRPVGTTAFQLRDGCAYLSGASILPEARGRGLYRALVAARFAAIRALGLPLAVTHAREATSAPMLAHLGFATVFRSRCWLLAPTRLHDPEG